jgi:hypothetical protein
MKTMTVTIMQKRMVKALNQMQKRARGIPQNFSTYWTFSTVE